MELKRTIVVFWGIVILGLFDIMTTTYILNAGGIEINPIFNWISNLWIMIVVMIIAKTLFYVILWILITTCDKMPEYHRNLGKCGILGIALFMGLTPVVNNMYHILIG
ncbi:MAG: hypothetical protein MNSN_03830 [Minisyncoccus archaeiphilus]|uniref:DUF5658 family protein n=1 Tax=Minisyncoccus archaeiphilus TaxID=3238481 RepID=UPI0009CB9A0C|nr:MAG: hypothetical protein BWY21_00414 [Parcubacteria group bacterium ADurb.Bin216]GMX59384.1 MAG: hypothetical protein MNSN_03830 [Candidatus Parcubacteria bacterium]